MSQIILRGVHMLSAAHGTSAALRTGKTSPMRLANSTIFTKENFPTFLATSMFVSGFAGWHFMGYLRSIDQRETLVYAD